MQARRPPDAPIQPHTTARIGGMFPLPMLPYNASTLPSVTQHSRCTTHTPQAHSTLLRHLSHRRNLAVYAHALVVFNVLGIPLSRGAELALSFTAASSTRLLSCALVVGLQYLFVLGTPLFTGCVYARTRLRTHWRAAFLLTALLVFGAQMALRWLEQYVFMLLLHGVVVPAGLGVLGTLSTLELSAHYKNKVALVSLQSGFAGFSGALVYALVARQRVDRCGGADAASAGVMLGTLVLAWVLSRGVGDAGLTPLRLAFPGQLGWVWRERGTLLFVAGLMLVFTALPIFPTYITLLLTQPPLLLPPEIALYALLATLSTAALAASITANRSFRQRLGPVDTLALSSISSGAVCLLPTFLPFNMYIAIGAGAAYGIGLGAVLALYGKASTVFHSGRGWCEDMPARAALMMVLCGLGACAGVVGGAAVLEGVEEGEKWVMGMAAGGMVIGGGLVGVGRWRRVGRWDVVV